MKIFDWLFGQHDAPGRFDLPSYKDPIKAPKVQIKHAANIILKNSSDSVIQALSGEWDPEDPKGTQGPLTYCPYVTIESSKKSNLKMDEEPIEVSDIPPIFNDAYIKMLKKITPPPPPNSRRFL